MLTRFDQDLIPHATLVVCPDGVKATFLGFDDDGDLIVHRSDLNGLNGVVTYDAYRCKLSEDNS